MLGLIALACSTICGHAGGVDFTGARLSNDWDKKALTASLSQGSIRIRAKQGLAFDDASSWTVRLAKPVPVSPEQALVFSISTGKSHRPFWQNLLFSLRVNGKPVEAVATLSTARLDLVVADNGEPYAPYSPNGRFTMAVAIPSHQLKSMTILTAGAAGMDMTLSSFRLEQRATVMAPAQRVQQANLSQQEIAAMAQEAWGAFSAFSAEPQHYGLRHDPAKRAVLLEDQSQMLDVSGGWFDAGDYGRYTVNTAHSAKLILLSHTLAPDAVSTTALAQSGVRGALDWLLKMQRGDGAAYHKVASADFPPMTTTPDGDRAKRTIAPITSTATAQLATALHLGAMVFDDPAYGRAADRARAWLARNPGLKMIPARFGKHAYGGHYGDDEDGDERFMALAAHQLRTGRSSLTQADFATARKRFLKTRGDAGWKNTDLFGLWMVQASGDARGQDLLQQTADHWLSAQSRSPLRIPYVSEEPVLWGFNGRMALRAWHMALAGQTFTRADWAQGGRATLGWFFGGNPNGQIMVTGKGKGRIKHPHFRPHTSGAIALPEGLLVGGPNQETDLKAHPPLARHVDDAASYRTNEVAINWQAAFASALSLIAHQRDDLTTGSVVPLP
ncbi:MAG: glycoside hydrolase family 9 protein [Pseudomonadota bacterium]